MKDFTTWMRLKENTAPRTNLRNAFGQRYKIVQDDPERMTAVVNNDGSEIEDEDEIDEIPLGNGEYAYGKVTLYGSHEQSDKLDYPHGAAYSGVSIDAVSVHKNDLKIVDQDDKTRPATVDDMEKILIDFMSSKKALNAALNKIDPDGPDRYGHTWQDR